MFSPLSVIFGAIELTPTISNSSSSVWSASNGVCSINPFQVKRESQTVLVTFVHSSFVTPSRVADMNIRRKINFKLHLYTGAAETLSVRM